MPEPDYQINRPFGAAHRRRYRRHSRLLLLLLLTVILTVAVVAYIIFHSQHAGEKSAIGATYTQRIAGPQTFTSKYFQFSDNEKWVFAPNDSTATKLTYLLYQSGVPAHSLTVYVNQTPLQDELAVNRVLPVRIVAGNSFSVGDISPSCSTLYGPTTPEVIKPVSLSDSSFLCVPDTAQYLVVVGQLGGNYDLALKRADGSTAQYIIIYHNLSINPDPTPFLRIMKSFKTL